MKRTVLATAIALLCVAAYGQSFESMWKAFDKAMLKDLPKSALAQSQAIYAKASAEGNVGHTLKAALTSLRLNDAISPDSGKVHLARLDSLAAKSQSPVVKAVTNLAMARLHSGRQRYDDPAEGDKALACYIAATADLGIFDAHKAGEFIPATVEGDDSRYFNHELTAFVLREVIDGLDKLHYTSAGNDSIHAMRLNLSHALINRYRTKGNGNAVVLATIDSLEREGMPHVTSDGHTDSSSYKVAQQLIAQYGGSTCAVEAYIYACQFLQNTGGNRKELLTLARLGAKEYASNKRSNMLRNIESNITRPHCTANLTVSNPYEGQSVMVHLAGVNVNNARLTFYRLPFRPTDKLVLDRNYDKLRKKVSGTAFIVNKALNRKDEYSDITDSVEVTFNDKGLYLLELTTDKKTLPDRCVVSVSNLRIVSMDVPPKNLRLTVVDARSGHPVPGAGIAGLRYDDKNQTIIDTYTANERGEVIVAPGGYRSNTMYFPYSGNDVYAFGMRCYGATDYNWNNRVKDTEARLYTDRAIYRPGQKVNVGGIVYSREGNSFNTIYDRKITLTLLDANGKDVATEEVASDEFGAFGVDFELPQSCLPGMFRIKAGTLASASFRVEEYKRPTFEVQLSQPDTAYSLGDTVSAKGRALTFTGIGVTGARVEYEVSSSTRMWIAARRNDSAVLRDTTVTDCEGNFTIRIPLTPAQPNVPTLRNIARYFTADVTVTSPDGESQKASLCVSVGKEPAMLVCDLPAFVPKSNIPRITFSLTNAAGEELDGRGEYIIYKGKEKVASAAFEANKATDVPALKLLSPGKYRIEAEVPGMTDSTNVMRHDFTLFTFNDTQPADSTDIWMYATSDVLPRDSDITLQIGTSMHDVVAFYDVTGNGKLLESRHISMSDTIISLKYRYKEEFGDGLSVYFGFVRNGVAYHNVRQLKKPEPDKRLRFKWTTFRNRLQPGAAEEWSLSVYEPDGSPAKASAIAALYDASLDKFAKNYWNASLGFFRFVPVGNWAFNKHSQSLCSEPRTYNRSVPLLQFDKFDENLFTSYYSWAEEYALSSTSGKRRARSSVKLLGNIANAPAMAESKDLVKYQSAVVADKASAKQISMADAGGTHENGSEELPYIPVRENFAETAFFMPALKTGDNGQLSIAFTVPESMTRWNFKLLAHTRDMNMGLLDTTAIVAKDFMVQPNLPRFLRKGDEACISATVRNVTANVLSGTATLVLEDAQTGAVVTTLREKFSVAGNAQSVVGFKFTSPNEIPLLVCRITADAGTCADGEQHYLPVLTDEAEHVAAMPFTFIGQGTHTVNVDSFLSSVPTKARNRRLAIEYTSNPVWYAVQALPSIAEPREKDAISLATAFYATTLSRAISELSPELSKAAAHWAADQSGDTLIANALARNEDLKNIVLNETPWLAEAGYSGNRRDIARLFNAKESAARARNLLERLTLLQQDNGGWSWFPGMYPNLHITLRVLDMLARLEEITGDKAASAVINNGLRFADKAVAEEISRMKELSGSLKPATADNSDFLTYLDILRRAKRKLSSVASANSRELTSLLAKRPVMSNMRNKALSVGILLWSGQKAEARTALQSLMEHTVTRPGMGRYFDTERATLTNDSYKIPTHVAAIEALRLAAPTDSATLRDMLTWLIQAKRTQSWSNERNTVDAVYALLREAGDTDNLLHFDTRLPAFAGLTLKDAPTCNLLSGDTADSLALGYLRRDFGLDTIKAAPLMLTISKTDGGISWGGVYCSSLVPATEAASNKGELTVERTYMIEKDGHFIEMPKSHKPHTGDRIRVKYTITAARDFDFVSLQDAPPACIEPETWQSGYTFIGGEACYHVARDASQGFFFEHLAKGQHTVYCDFRVDRAGRYLVGAATVQCLYSPEFEGSDKGFTINTQQ